MAEIAAPSACTRPVMERKVRPQKDQALNCPRCHSTNTKFCYYNNYSLTQPRYFCKTCRRYWTEGGTLRNVPVGGGSRKNKKSTSTSSPSLSMITPPIQSHKLPDLNPPSISQFSSQNPKIHDQGQDLNLGFQGHQQGYHHGVPQFLEFPKIESRDFMNSSSSANSSSSSTQLSALNFLRNGIAARGLNSFIPMGQSPLETNAIFASGFPFQESKPSLSFPIDGVNGSRYGNSNVPQENINNGSLMFTLGAPKRNSSTSEADQDKGQENSNGFWNGMLGGGSW